MTLPLDLTPYDRPLAVPTPSQHGEALELIPRADAAAATVDRGAEDMHRAVALVHAIGGDPSESQAMKILGEPWSKGRPRFRRDGQAYQAPEDRAAEKALAATLIRWRAQPYPGNVALAAVFYRPNRQRIDADNLLKHVCDSATGILWADDSQVTAVVGVIELDPGLPRTVIATSRHASTLTRGSDWTNTCVQCGDAFVVDPRNNARRYCSNECSDQARGYHLKATVPCAQCGEPFRRAASSQKYCGPPCRAAAVRGSKRPSGVPFSICPDCGIELSHRRGGRCRRCWALRAKGLTFEVLP